MDLQLLDRLDVPETYFAPPPALGKLFSAPTLDMHFRLQQRYRDRVAPMGPDWSLRRLAASGNFDAQQLYAHRVYWASLQPEVHRFDLQPRERKALEDAAATVKGSGWLWIRKTRRGSYDVAYVPVQTAGAPPFGDEMALVVDLWEHAYLLDWSIGRPRYVTQMLRYLRWDLLFRS